MTAKVNNTSVSLA